MIWLSIIMTVINLILKAPEIADAIRRIIELFRSKGPLRAAREAPKLLAALEAKLALCEQKGIVPESCPLAAYTDDLRSRWGVVA